MKSKNATKAKKQFDLKAKRKDEQARMYRIPSSLAGKLWEYEETSLESIYMTIANGKEERVPDKRLIVEVESLLSWVSKFKGSVLSDALARAIYDSYEGDIEWTEPPARIISRSPLGRRTNK